MTPLTDNQLAVTKEESSLAIRDLRFIAEEVKSPYQKRLLESASNTIEKMSALMGQISVANEMIGEVAFSRIAASRLRKPVCPVVSGEAMTRAIGALTGCEVSFRLMGMHDVADEVKKSVIECRAALIPQADTPQKH